jgi:NADP-dependent 3-hydroxy acid dehydrogenase YdfG
MLKNLSFRSSLIFHLKTSGTGGKMFQDKVIIVTGASEGIGRALCLSLAQQKPRLVIAARNQSRLDELKTEIESSGTQALVVPTDVRDETENGC